MKKFIALIILSFLIFNVSHADFKKIKKKAKVSKPEIIFPIKKDKKKCITDMYITPDINYIKPILKVEAPSGYGLDDRFDKAKSKFEDFSFPCSGGNVEACQNVKRVILEWAKADAAKRTGPSDSEGRHWNDTLTVNLYIASPMMAAYSFAKQVISIPDSEDRIIKDWFKRIVKKNKHVKLGIRSEFIDIADKESHNTVKVKINRIEDFGNFKLLTSTLENKIIKSKIDREKPISENEVNLYIPPEKCCVYVDEKLI